ncbi:MAG: hypothetical protein ABIS47_14300, partial [Acidimicrobiales bacterium]
MADQVNQSAPAATAGRAEGDAARAAEAVALAGRLLAEGRRRTTWAQRRRAGRLARLLKDRAGLAL